MIRAVAPTKLNACIGNIRCSCPLVVTTVISRLGSTEIAGRPLDGQAKVNECWCRRRRCCEGLWLSFVQNVINPNIGNIRVAGVHHKILVTI